MDKTLVLKLLGSPQISIDEKPITQFISRKAQALLIYIIVTGKLHSRAVLAELFWQNRPSNQSMKNLRAALSNLRQLVGAHLIITRQTVTFNGECPYDLDVEAIQAIANRPVTDNLQFLSEAVTQYRGDFLEGFYVPDAPDFENWALMERERLRELAIEGLHSLAEQYLRQQNYMAGLAATRKLLAIDPWRETAHRQQMIFFARTGQRRAALAQYNSCLKILVDEFGIEPMAETTAVYEQIRVGDICESNIIQKESSHGKEESSLGSHAEVSYKVEHSKQLSSPSPGQIPIAPPPLNSPLYIERPPIEQDAWAKIKQPVGWCELKRRARRVKHR